MWNLVSRKTTFDDLVCFLFIQKIYSNALVVGFLRNSAITATTSIPSPFLAGTVIVFRALVLFTLAFSKLGQDFVPELALLRHLAIGSPDSLPRRGQVHERPLRGLVFGPGTQEVAGVGGTEEIKKSTWLTYSHSS